MKLSLLYVHGESLGYGRLGVNLAKELTFAGHTIYDHLPGPDDTLMAHLNEGRCEGIAETVCWISVPTHARGWWKGQRPVIFTMWESSALPESFRENLHEFDLIVVPSQQNLELFSRYHNNVKCVPLGVDPALWHFIPREEPGLFFDYLVAGSGARKGTDLAFRAFRALWGKDGSWGDGPVPRLVMKNPRGEEFYGDRVEMISGRLGAQQEVDLYARAHCYLQPSRGEGFGLQPLQAIAQGCPTILTAAHGHEAFAHLGLGISAAPAPSAYFIYGDAGDWWEPSFDELCDRMRWVYDHYHEACADAQKAAWDVTRRFTWAHTARSFLEALGPGYDGDYTGPLEWFNPEVKRFPVIVRKDWHAEIAGTAYQFKRGQTFWEVADVKRILFEADLLDPACLTPVGPNGETEWDTGLTAAQVEKIPAYTAAWSYCETCGTKLGTGERRSDDELVEEFHAHAGDLNGSQT
jgi:glycosyltransferase involved in cell wall biosynthesis